MPSGEAGSVDDGESRQPSGTAGGTPVGVEEAAETLCRVARVLAEKPMSIEEAAARLGLPPVKVRSALAALSSHGYVEIVEVKPCTGCPFARVCPLARLRRPIRLYRLVSMPPWCRRGR